jgi:uncharacterized repeat protein (TIGR02543 family)
VGSGENKGKVAQLLDPRINQSYHAANTYYAGEAIGIEQIATEANPKQLEDLYETTAKLVKYLCQEYDIPMDRAHIFGHDEAPSATPTKTSVVTQHVDPGPLWNWGKFFALMGVDLAEGGRTFDVEPGDVVTIAPEYEKNLNTFIHGCTEWASAYVVIDGQSQCPAQNVVNFYNHPSNFVYTYSAPDSEVYACDAVYTDLPEPLNQLENHFSNWIMSSANHVSQGQKIYVEEVRSDGAGGNWLGFYWGNGTLLADDTRECKGLAWIHNSQKNPIAVVLPSPSFSLNTNAIDSVSTSTSASEGEISASITSGQMIEDAQTWVSPFYVSPKSLQHYEIYENQTYPVLAEVTSNYWPGGADNTVKFYEVQTAHRIMYVESEYINVHKIQNVTVSFDSNGGSNVAKQVLQRTAKAKMPANPAKSGYRFKGWFIDQDLTELFDFSNNHIRDNITLYAKWEKNPPPAPSPTTKSCGISPLACNLNLGKTLAFTDTIGLLAERIADINWLSQTGITVGTGYGNNLKYLPNNAVNRGAVAEFLLKTVGSPQTTKAVPLITDISELKTNRQNAIKWLASEEVTKVDSTLKKYYPANSVNRGALAELMYKLAGSPGVIKLGDEKEAHPDPKILTAQEDKFKGDKDLQKVKESNPNRYYDILWLAKMNITFGSNAAGTLYSPQKVVNRGAMAQFLHRLYYVMATGEAAPADGVVPDFVS